MARSTYPSSKQRARGFFAASDYASPMIKTTCGKRGFSEARILTDWALIMGEALAQNTMPVKVTYQSGRDLGGTLVLWASGASAVEVEHRSAGIIERINGFYGYQAITRLRLTQTAGASPPRRTDGRRLALRPVTEGEYSSLVPILKPISSQPLREALEQLGQNIIGRGER